MANEPNYSREELLRIVSSWDEDSYTIDIMSDERQKDYEYTIYRSDIIKLGTTAAIILSDLQIILEKDWEQKKLNLKTYKDEYSITWVYLDIEYIESRYPEFNPVDVDYAVQKLIDSSEISFSQDLNKPFYTGWYAERRYVLRAEAVSEIEANISLGKNSEEAMVEAMKKFYPTVYEDMNSEG